VLHLIRELMGICSPPASERDGYRRAVAIGEYQCDGPLRREMKRFLPARSPKLVARSPAS